MRQELTDRQVTIQFPHKRVVISDIEKIVRGTELDQVLIATGSEIAFDQSSTAAQARVESWFYYKLRDRGLDGPGWQTDRLTNWAYDKEVDCTVVPSVEESTYWLDPRGCLSRRYEHVDREFIINPFEALPDENADVDQYIGWNNKWEELMTDHSLPYPGYFSDITIPGLRRQILERSLKVLGDLGYAQLTAVPTWFHIAKMYEHLGFEYNYNSDKEKMDQLSEALSQDGIENKVEKSWVLMRQFWAQQLEGKLGIEPEQLVSKGRILRDVEGRILTYPLTPERNLWMYRWI
jgi:hypothetical protein